MTIEQVKRRLKKTIEYHQLPLTESQAGRLFQAEQTLKMLNEIQSVEVFKLECLTEDGLIEENGYYSKLELAEKAKKELDSEPRNIKYGIKQNIITIEIMD